MNQGSRYMANPVVSVGKEDDGAVLYNPDIDISSVVNLSGSDLWMFLKSPRSSEEIIAYLIDKYSEVSVEQATKDTKLFIDTLTPDFLLVIEDGG